MNYLVLVAVFFVLIVTTFWSLLAWAATIIEPPRHSQEPPEVKSDVPLVGHAWGLYRHGPKYFQYTSAQVKLPIHTLKILSGKVYVITSPSIISLVSKNTKSISFNPFIAEVGIRLTHASKEARTIIERNVDGSEGKDSYVIEIHDCTVSALSVGPEMQRLALFVLRKAWNEFFRPLDDPAIAKGTEVSLYAFLQHMLTQTSTTAIYGQRNPLRLDPSLEQAFWDFNNDMNMLLLDTYPAVTARKGHRAREWIAEGFRAFFQSDPVGRSSHLAEGRYLIGSKHGMSNRDMGRLEVGTMIGILVNTVPTLFYLLCHIFEASKLLSDIRQEIERNAIDQDGSGGQAPALNISNLRDRCPLLQSTFQETLRTYSEGASVRLVCEDTMIDGYLLKKGSILQMPNSVIHRDRSIWGDPAFNPRRFFKQQQKSGSASTTAASSYRPFGGGSTLCPGRQFATSEIVGLAAVFVLQFDLSPANGRKWAMPPPKQHSVVEAVFPPSHDIDVLIRRREGSPLRGGWTFRFGEVA